MTVCIRSEQKKLNGGKTTITSALNVQQALNGNSIFYLPENAQILSWVTTK